jgi:hypothetical protein
VRRELALCLIGFAVLSPGCSLVSTATHNLVTETQRCTTEYVEGVRERRLARDSWGMAAAGTPGRVFSEDYVGGFEDGFVDFLHNGGAGLPPPLPPERYRQVRYETPEGHVAVAQWFDGFRDGAAAARASGYRQFVTVPVALAEPPIVAPQPHVLRPHPLPANEFLPPGEQLPTPRKVEPSETPGGPKTFLAPPVPLHDKTEVSPPAPGNSVLSTQYEGLSTKDDGRTTKHTPRAEPSPLALIRSVEPQWDPVVVLSGPAPVPDDELDDDDDDPAEAPLAGK